MNGELSQAAVVMRRLSSERLGPYLAAAGGDLATALDLYIWNAEVSAALATTIGHVEVVMRNTFHEHLTAWLSASREN